MININTRRECTYVRHEARHVLSYRMLSFAEGEVLQQHGSKHIACISCEEMRAGEKLILNSLCTRFNDVVLVPETGEQRNPSSRAFKFKTFTSEK